MNQHHIFIDTNVLIGYFAGMKDDKAAMQYLFSLNGKRLFVSSLSIAQLASVFQKTKTGKDVRTYIRTILHKCNVLDFTQKDIEESLCIEATDIEDNMQYVIGSKMDCFYFVTNNRKDFTAFNNIYVLTPQNVRNIKKN